MQKTFCPKTRKKSSKRNSNNNAVNSNIQTNQTIKNTNLVSGKDTAVNSVYCSAATVHSIFVHLSRHVSQHKFCIAADV